MTIIKLMSEIWKFHSFFNSISINVVAATESHSVEIMVGVNGHISLANQGQDEEIKPDMHKSNPNTLINA